MSDIFTSLWLDIDKYNYKNTRIEYKDLESFNKARKNFIVRPATVLIFTYIFSKNRVRLWNSFRKFIFKGRRSTPYIQSIKKDTIEPAIKEQPEKIIKESPIEVVYKHIEPHFNEVSSDSAIKLTYQHSRKLTSRKERKMENQTEETFTVTRKEPTIREEYLSSFTKMTHKVPKFTKLKLYFRSTFPKEAVKNQGEHFLLTTKWIYLPFVIIFLISLYELGLTYLGLYFKYQPLVDEYYIQKKNKINNKI